MEMVKDCVGGQNSLQAKSKFGEQERKSFIDKLSKNNLLVSVIAIIAGLAAAWMLKIMLVHLRKQLIEPLKSTGL